MIWGRKTDPGGAVAGERTEHFGWVVLGLGLLGGAATLVAAYLLLSEMLGSRSFSQCESATPAVPLPGCPASAQWWVAYGILFPAGWRGLSLSGFAWLGAGCLGLVATGLHVWDHASRLGVILLALAAVAAIGAAAVVLTIVLDTARDAPINLWVAIGCALTGAGILGAAAWQARRQAWLAR
jgi:hypothetical protein